MREKPGLDLDAWDAQQETAAGREPFTCRASCACPGAASCVRGCTYNASCWTT